MDALQEFLSRCTHFCQSTDMAKATLSAKILSGGTRIASLENGTDIGVRKLKEATNALKGLERQYGVKYTPPASLQADAGPVPPSVDFAVPEAGGGTDLSDAVACDMAGSIAGAK